MNLEQLKINDLIEAGAHFGHPVRKWNPIPPGLLPPTFSRPIAF